MNEGDLRRIREGGGDEAYGGEVGGEASEAFGV